MNGVVHGLGGGCKKNRETLKFTPSPYTPLKNSIRFSNKMIFLRRKIVPEIEKKRLAKINLKISIKKRFF